MKTRSFEAFRDEQLRDEELRREYESMEPQFYLAREVLELRREKHLAQKELAEQMGTSQPAIARIESCSYRNLSLAFIRRLADALDAIPEIHLRKGRLSTLGY